MERRWNKKVVSLVSSVTVVMRLPISCVSSAQWPSHAIYQLSPLQKDRRRVVLTLAYLSVFFCAALLAAAPGVVTVLPTWDSAYVSGTVTSLAMGFPLAHGRIVVSGPLVVVVVVVIIIIIWFKHTLYHSL